MDQALDLEPREQVQFARVVFLENQAIFDPVAEAR